MTHLAAAIRAVLPHANRDEDSPSILGIQIRNSYALATDRFSVASARITAMHAVDAESPIAQSAPKTAYKAPDAFLTLDLAKLIAARKNDVIVAFDVDEERRVSVTFASGIIHSDLPPLTLDAQTFPYPPVERLFEDFKPGPMNAVRLSPKLLARYNPTATGHDGPIVIEANEKNTSLRVSIPDEAWFESLIASSAAERDKE